ncbi:hypothetical protein AALP_AA5G182600 [Arabis alpina]|uniref:Uncharacterized protein n=1 Tax=Arabis alpina TaxID=50452 RepID=A0A087GXW3_ARAAL|nr:hypothetical protein AALP_AA5G182600 [Arabis alpina]
MTTEMSETGKQSTRRHGSDLRAGRCKSHRETGIDAKQSRALHRRNHARDEAELSTIEITHERRRTVAGEDGLIRRRQ